MKRAIIMEFDKLAENLSNRNAVFGYRLMNLCVKAEEVSLLPIEVMIEGELQKLEECTQIGKKDEYSFMLFPNYDEDLVAIGKSVMMEHPEFKQKVETMTLDSIGDEGEDKKIDVHYLLLTMPEVDDDRYDVLKDAVDLCYDQCKAEMQAVLTKGDLKLAEASVGETEENLDRLKKGRDKLEKQWTEHRDKLYHDKLKEIEEAHNKWLAEQAEKRQEREEKEAAHGSGAALQMKMDRDD